ncbi:hypothetical protein Tco_0976708 [Tanacetum coccineum]|uniref:Retrotransposon gag domain-containing protein n=1 Tax=Tanacetum coccineum TaxID=301880 RepID=A0ABQ5EI03_9ASTR
MHQPLENLCGQSSTNSFLENTRGLDKIRLPIDDSILGSLRFVSKSKEYQDVCSILHAEMTNLKMRKSHAYKTYLAYATGAIPPKKARKFKKPASLSKKKTLVAVEEPAKKPPRNLLLEDNQLVVFKSKTLLVCLGQRRRHQQRLKEDSQLVFELLSKAALLEEVISPDFNLFSDQENSEEEVAETMAETMEQYMSKTRADYGSGVARPKIEDKDNFELKGQFLKELRTNTFSGSDHEDKMEEINNFQQEPDENLYQAWERFKELLMKCSHPRDGRILSEMAQWNLGREIKKVNEKVYAAQVGCEQCKGTHYTKDFPFKEEGKTLEEAYYMQFGGPFQGGGYRAATPGFYPRNNANPSHQE